VLYLLSIRQQFEATAWMIVVWWVLLIVAASIATLIATFRFQMARFVSERTVGMLLRRTNNLSWRCRTRNWA
jgi:hypothetical protein